MRNTDDQSHEGICVGCSCGGGGSDVGGPVVPCLRLLRFQQVRSEVGLEGEVGSQRGPLPS